MSIQSSNAFGRLKLPSLRVNLRNSDGLHNRAAMASFATNALPPSLYCAQSFAPFNKTARRHDASTSSTSSHSTNSTAYAFTPLFHADFPTFAAFTAANNSLVFILLLFFGLQPEAPPPPRSRPDASFTPPGRPYRIRYTGRMYLISTKSM